MQQSIVLLDHQSDTDIKFSQQVENFCILNHYFYVHVSLKNLDYSNYSILWRCEELPNNRSLEEAIVLGRSTSLSAAVNQKVTDLVTQAGLNRTDFRYISHTPEV
jgi:hypothetical protein